MLVGGRSHFSSYFKHIWICDSISFATKLLINVVMGERGIQGLRRG